MPNPNFLIQSGQGNQAVQGSGNTLNASVHIGNDSTEKQNQIQAITNLLAALEKHKAEVPPEALRSLENVKDELKEEKPDSHRVGKWLETAKYGLKTLGLVKECYDASSAAWIAFNLVFS